MSDHWCPRCKQRTSMLGNTAKDCEEYRGAKQRLKKKPEAVPPTVVEQILAQIRSLGFEARAARHEVMVRSRSLGEQSLAMVKRMEADPDERLNSLGEVQGLGQQIDVAATKAEHSRKIVAALKKIVEEK